MTKSEKFVADLCRKSFLPFWSFPSPIGKKGNELCDLLIICDKIIIIVSVKDITPSNHEDEVIVYERWAKKAIHESISQIYGAERFLKTVEAVQLKNSNYVVKLPPTSERVIYRIAIAFGNKPHYPLTTGHYGNGYVNVFDEKATETILKELDTITDFTNYLRAKQKFLDKNVIFIAPNETDFLALYLQTGLDFQIDDNTVVTGENLWERFIESEAYKNWKNDIEVSYVWDIMIQSVYLNHVKPDITSQKRDDIERSLQIINLESRNSRKYLGLVFEDTIKTRLKARMLPPFKGADYTYVFMPLTAENWDHKGKELDMRCFIARAEFPEIKKIVGIGMGRKSDEEITFDIGYLEVEEIDEKFIETAYLLKEELGFFKNIRMTPPLNM